MHADRCVNVGWQLLREFSSTFYTNICLTQNWINVIRLHPSENLLYIFLSGSSIYMEWVKVIFNELSILFFSFILANKWSDTVKFFDWREERKLKSENLSEQTKLYVTFLRLLVISKKKTFFLFRARNAVVFHKSYKHFQQQFCWGVIRLLRWISPQI